MKIPLISKWNDLTLIVNQTVPSDGYVITDARGVPLSGGNIRTGKQFVFEKGEPARIYAPEAVARELLMHPEAPNGAGKPH